LEVRYPAQEAIVAESVLAGAVMVQQVQDVLAFWWLAHAEEGAVGDPCIGLDGNAGAVGTQDVGQLVTTVGGVWDTKINPTRGHWGGQLDLGVGL
jgi:hypothetical protein